MQISEKKKEKKTVDNRWSRGQPGWGGRLPFSLCCLEGLTEKGRTEERPGRTGGEATWPSRGRGVGTDARAIAKALRWETNIKEAQGPP